MGKKLLAGFGAVGASLGIMSTTLLGTDAGPESLRVAGILMGVAGAGITGGVSYYIGALRTS